MNQQDRIKELEGRIGALESRLAQAERDRLALNAAYEAAIDHAVTQLQASEARTLILRMSQKMLIEAIAGLLANEDGFKEIGLALDSCMTHELPKVMGIWLPIPCDLAEEVAVSYLARLG